MVPANRVYILYDRSITSNGYKEVKFYQEIDDFGLDKPENKKEINKMIERFLAPPNELSMTREH